MESLDTSVVSARILLDVAIAHGVETIILSPGSRNTPLLIGASARKKLKKYIINDERTAAFTALGIATVSQKPVALACTSGSALYNYAPAIAEAFYRHIPLTVISADRPLQWISQDSQTLVQPYALSGIVKGSYSIPSQNSMQGSANENFLTEYEWYVNRISNEALNLAQRDVKGPVHINIEFEAPFNGLQPYRDEEIRIIRETELSKNLNVEKIKELASRISEKKVLIVAGQLSPDHKLQRALSDFSRLTNVFVLAEPLSNLHLDSLNLVSNQLFSPEYNSELKELNPDIIISIGGIPVSENLKSFVRNCEDAEVWTLGDTNSGDDRYMRLVNHFDVSPDRFFKSLVSMIRHLSRKGLEIKNKGYREKWIDLMRKFRKSRTEFLDNDKWSEIKALKIITQHIPDNYNLFLSNGMLIRKTMDVISRLPHSVYANRGVSGIEGTNATALGASLSYKGPSLLLTGDMSFSYCPDILNLAKLGGDLRIIVINNKGGGIFREIATTRSLPCREEYFCNAPELPLEKLAEAYSWAYVKADSEKSLIGALSSVFSQDKTIVEVFVPNEI